MVDRRVHPRESKPKYAPQYDSRWSLPQERTADPSSSARCTMHAAVMGHCGASTWWAKQPQRPGWGTVEWCQLTCLEKETKSKKLRNPKSKQSHPTTTAKTSNQSINQSDNRTMEWYSINQSINWTNDLSISRNEELTSGQINRKTSICHHPID